MASDAVESTAGAPSGGGASQSGSQTPAAPAVDKGDRKERVARARAEAERKHKATRAPRAFDPKAEAKKALAERKAGLSLVDADGERVERRPARKAKPVDREQRGDERDDSEPVDDADHEISPDSRDDAEDTGSETDHEGDEGDEQEPEKPPTWAKKLRDENTNLKQREQRWNDAVEKIEGTVRAKEQQLQVRAWEIEDLKETVKLHESIRNQLIGMLNKVAPGRFVPESLDKLLLVHEKRTLERRIKRGEETAQQAQQAQMRSTVTGQVRQQMDALRKQYPELDWEKSEAAKSFLQRYAKRGIAISEITQEEIRDFVAAQRFLATQRRTGNQGTGRPTDVPDRPTESLRSGQSGTRRRAAEPISVNTPITTRMARKIVNDFRAAKQARR